MDIVVVNAIVCDRTSNGLPYDLLGVGSRWIKPPKRFAVWVEISNPSERSFSVGLELYRGRGFVGETADELVLEGRPLWQGHWDFATATGLMSKTYSFVVLLDGIPARTIPLDFGHPEGK